MNKNKSKIITVKELREQLRYTQQAFASLIGSSQYYIANLEHDLKTLDTLSVKTLLNISKLTNQSINNLLNNKITDYNENQLLINDMYSDSVLEKTNKNRAFDNYDLKHNNIDKVITLVPQTYNFRMFDNNYNNQRFFDFEKAKRKPVTAVFGARSSGKSSFINSILGKDLLPVSVYSKTNCTIHFKDIKDKPEYIKENVLIFKIAKESNYKFDPEIFLLEKTYTKLDKEYRIILDNTEIYYVRDYNNPEKLNYKSIKQFYENENISDSAYEIYIINFVADTPILKNTDIIDTIGTDKMPLDIPKQTKRKLFFSPLYIPLYICDIAVCLFENCSSLEDNDREILDIIKDNKTENLMIVASKADIRINDDKDILNIISEATNSNKEICSTYSVKNDRKDLRIEFENQFKEKIKNTIENKIKSILNSNYNTMNIEEALMELLHKNSDNKDEISTGKEDFSKLSEYILTKKEEDEFNANREDFIKYCKNVFNKYTDTEKENFSELLYEYLTEKEEKHINIDNKTVLLISFLRDKNIKEDLVKNISDINYETFFYFKETAKQDFKKFYDTVFESEKEKNND
ncbi:MAG: dynamin family protein, partial [Elusimicrobia bacterium]|nr:dynamin family protein [Elusimicrobiota bacterium]